VRRHELAVEQFCPVLPHGSHQPGQGDFRCVPFPAEHAFAAEHPVKAHAIEPADQLTLAPALDRMGLAQIVEAAIACRDSAADPAFAIAVVPGGGAGIHHFVKSGVAGDGESSAPQGSGQRA